MPTDMYAGLYIVPLVLVCDVHTTLYIIYNYMYTLVKFNTSCRYCLSQSNKAIAALMCALYPHFPATSTDNRSQPKLYTISIYKCIIMYSTDIIYNLFVISM